MPDKKKKKNDLLLSSMHHQPTLEENGKPEIVMYCSNTKGGMDSLDQMCSLYSCSRKTRRWPLCVLYEMLNIVAVNSYVIYSSNMRRNRWSIISRNNFLEELTFLFIRPWAEERAAQRRMEKSARDTVSSVFDITLSQQLLAFQGNGRWRRCIYCCRGKNTKVKPTCSSCGASICPTHSRFVCPQC